MNYNISPIFIVGMARSGTTLLSNILNASGEIYFPEEIRFFDSLARYNSLIFKRRYKNFNDYYIDDTKYLFKYLNFSRGELDKLKKIEDRKELFEAIINLKIENKKVIRLGEKTPLNFLYIDDILTFYPNAIFIHIVRDPRDVISSQIKANWIKIFPLYFVLNLYKKAFALINSGRYNDIIFNVKYEDLIQNPQEEIEKLFKFCQIDFYPSIMDDFYKKENLNFNINNEPWKAKNSQPIDAFNSYKWKKNENRTLNKFISWYLKDEISLLGYDKGKYLSFPYNYFYCCYIYVYNILKICKNRLLG